ncbi:hypothetical protein E8E14_014412 [Neopestalotiopsis sp. 37M]|nr:hypothetical protein E8E14_014412 [Neopestalotiopsis sp. 37M]
MGINFYLSYQWLYWTRPSGPPSSLPTGIERMSIKTAGGNIELLCAKATKPTSKTPVVFAHGGMGCAWVWIPYMQYLQERGIASYAVSTRGHGESWHPSFLRMSYATTKRMLGDDLLAGIKAVERMEGSEVVLVGHSSGGGLSQFIVNEGDVKVKALGLLDAVPGTGSYQVYYNWWRLDPWFSIRMIFHGWHSNSPLSHPYLTRQAFFSSGYPDVDLHDFQRHLSRYESFLWPMGMLLPFIDAKKVVSNITGWGKGERIFIMAGTGDRLMTSDVQEKSAMTYREALGCAGAARTGPLQIAYWLEFGHECPIQIKRWLMGETDIPRELFDLLCRAGCTPPTTDLSDNNAKKEFHGWFINNIMARFPTPSWPVWLVDIGGIRRHALIRHAWDEYGRGFKTLTWPDISFGVTHPIWEMTEWRQMDTEPGRDFLWARDRLALMEAYGLEIDQGHG